MNPTTPRIAILQFDSDNPPGDLALFLEDAGQAFEVVRLDLTPLAALDDYHGYALMGGPMMVGDDLPWMQRVLERLRRNIAERRPTLGHCLGAQLFAHAAGARVGPCPHPEVGWIEVEPVISSVACNWLGEYASADRLSVFHWHLQSFDLPAGAELLLTRSEMPTQAFALGPHVAFQSHIEVDQATLIRWYGLQPDPQGCYPVGSIQSPEEAIAEAPTRLLSMRPLARVIYQRWLGNVRAYFEAGSKP